MDLLYGVLGKHSVTLGSGDSRCQFRQIELEDRETINQIREKYNNKLSSHSFVALYIWQRNMKLTIYLENDFFIVKNQSRGRNCYFFPCGAENKKYKFIHNLLKNNEEQLEFCFMSDHDKAFLEENFENTFTFYEERNSFEYIYSIEQQIKLPGKKFRYMRKNISRISKNENLIVDRLSKENIQRANCVLMKWNKERRLNSHSYYGDTEASILALEAFDKLQLSGIIVKNEREDLGIVVGAAINEEIYDIHIAKCLKNYSGLDFYCKQMLYKTLAETYKYINQEEDLGMEGIRMHKLNQQPVSLIRIWKGRSNNDAETYLE